MNSAAYYFGTALRLESAIPAPFLSWESGRRDLNSNLQAVQKSLTLFSPLAQQKKPSRANVANAPDSRQSVRIDRPLRQNAFSRKRRRFVKIRSVMELPVCKKLSRSSPLRFPVLLPSPRPCCSTWCCRHASLLGSSLAGHEFSTMLHMP